MREKTEKEKQEGDFFAPAELHALGWVGPEQIRRRRREQRTGSPCWSL